jgi:hypothetical protein
VLVASGAARLLARSSVIREAYLGAGAASTDKTPAPTTARDKQFA